jgi:hypothetical protein
MGRMSRSKGQRIERELVNLHLEMGVQARRVPLSGASDYNGGHDVDIYALGDEQAPLVFEVKSRGEGNGFRLLDRWLGSYCGLFLRRDRQDPMVVLAWHAWTRTINELLRIREELAKCLAELARLKNAPQDAIFAKPVANGGTDGETRTQIRGIPPHA